MILGVVADDFTGGTDVASKLVRAGAQAVTACFANLRRTAVRFAVCDTTATDQLDALAEACADSPLVTAGSGLALGLPAAHVRRGWVTLDTQASSKLPAVGARAAVLAGSSSSATNTQAHERPLLLALKSGNFGRADFFSRALALTR